MRFIFTIILLGLMSVMAAAADSSYTKYNLDKDCKFDDPDDDEMAGMGASAICKKAGKPDFYFSEGDLRHSVGFGAQKTFESFGVWNNMGSTVEWRSDQNGIYAAILRFYVSNYNNDTGEFDTGNQGQILMVHRVANTTADSTCVIGMIDARANKDANILARKVADTLTNSFDCALDIPQYHGIKGEHSADFMVFKPAKNETTTTQ